MSLHWMPSYNWHVPTDRYIKNFSQQITNYIYVFFFGMSLAGTIVESNVFPNTLVKWKRGGYFYDKYYKSNLEIVKSGKENVKM